MNCPSCTHPKENVDKQYCNFCENLVSKMKESYPNTLTREDREALKQRKKLLDH